MNLVIGLIMIFLRNATINAINKIWKQLIMAKLTINPPTMGSSKGEIKQSHHAEDDDQQYKYKR